MKNFYSYSLLFVLLNCFVSSCSNNNSRFTEGNYFFSFDDVAGYVKDNPTLVKDNALSGLYCLKIDSLNKYGLTFKQRIGNISTKMIDKIKLRGWVKCNNIELLKGQLVCQIDSAEKNVFWYGEDFNKFVTASNEWTQISTMFSIEKNNNIDNMIKIYPTNYGGETFYFDDLEISFK